MQAQTLGKTLAMYPHYNSRFLVYERFSFAYLFANSYTYLCVLYTKNKQNAAAIPAY